MKKIIILYCCAIILNTVASAAGIIGGNLRYQNLGGMHYRIYATINRECDGDPLSIPSISVFSGNTSHVLSATRISIADQSMVCNKIVKPCNPSNTKIAHGVEQHIFTAEIDFNTSPYNVYKNPGSCKVYFSLEACCRSQNITNMSAGTFYLEAYLNLCDLKTDANTSVESLASPSQKSCFTYPYGFSFLGSDKVDHDSLAYELKAPRFHKDSEEIYSKGLSANVPFTPLCSPLGSLNCTPHPNAYPPQGFYFDSRSGNIIFLAVNTDDKGVFQLRANEFRRISGQPVLVGYSSYEFFLDIDTCPPNISPYFTSNNTYAVCEGSKLCFTIETKDPLEVGQTIPDTLSLSWDTGIANGSFIIANPAEREKKAQFCWQTKVGDATQSPYVFSVHAEDNNCDIPKSANRQYAITVKSTPRIRRNYYKLPGNKLVFEAVRLDSQKVVYQWTVRDSSNSGSDIKFSYARVDSVVFDKKGKYIVEFVAFNTPNNCPTTYFDTITIDGKTGIHNITWTKPTVYPNPGTGIYHIEGAGILYSIMRVYNSIGELVFEGVPSDELDILHLASGIYELRLQGMFEDSRIKVIKY